METETILRTTANPKDVEPCPDYDEDCKTLDSPSKCFLGGLWTCPNGGRAYVDMATGYCVETGNK